VAGIAAVFHVDGSPPDPSSIAAIAEAMAYRGPDGTRTTTGSGFALAHSRFCTTAEAFEDHQPVESDDRSIIAVFDGYLANADELRSDLLARGAMLRSRSDAELVMHAYQTWGPDCPQRIEGEFAFIVADTRTKALFAATDHQALRTLHYHWDGKRLVIATDVAGVLAGLPFTPDLNHGFLAEVMAEEWYTLDETPWAGVMRLAPAQSLNLDGAGLGLREYWSLPTAVTIRYSDERQYAEHYREVLFESVRRACRSHLPVGIEVSGGLDSSAIFCVAHELDSAGRLPAPAIRGFSLAGIPGTGSDERAFVQAVSDHVRRPIRSEPMFLDRLDWFARRVAEDRDLPPRPNLAMGLNMFGAMAQDGCRVSLNGIGGDQWLDGTFNYYFELMADRQWHDLAAATRADAQAYGRKITAQIFARYGLWQFAPSFLRHAKTRLAGHRAPDGSLGEALLSPVARQELSLRRERHYAGLPADGRDRYKIEKHRCAALCVAMASWNRQLARCGLEPRSPLLSRAFITFSATTPEITRLRGGVTRRVHREALRGILPEEVRIRRDKAEFSAGFNHYRAELATFVARPLTSNTDQVVDSNAFSVMAQKFCGAAIDHLPLGEVWNFYEYGLLLSKAGSKPDH
jgi:asparagine synthase (glutamine-hydrolysing)